MWKALGKFSDAPPPSIGAHFARGKILCPTEQIASCSGREVRRFRISQCYLKQSEHLRVYASSHVLCESQADGLDGKAPVAYDIRAFGADATEYRLRDACLSYLLNTPLHEPCASVTTRVPMLPRVRKGHSRALTLI